MKKTTCNIVVSIIFFLNLLVDRRVKYYAVHSKCRLNLNRRISEFRHFFRYIIALESMPSIFQLDYITLQQKHVYMCKCIYVFIQSKAKLGNGLYSVHDLLNLMIDDVFINAVETFHHVSHIKLACRYIPVIRALNCTDDHLQIFIRKTNKTNTKKGFDGVSY